MCVVGYCIYVKQFLSYNFNNLLFLHSFCIVYFFMLFTCVVQNLFFLCVPMIMLYLLIPLLISVIVIMCTINIRFQAFMGDSGYLRCLDHVVL
jgi:hypothetical protein